MSEGCKYKVTIITATLSINISTINYFISFSRRNLRCTRGRGARNFLKILAIPRKWKSVSFESNYSASEHNLNIINTVILINKFKIKREGGQRQIVGQNLKFFRYIVELSEYVRSLRTFSGNLINSPTHGTIRCISEKSSVSSISRFL